MIKPLIAALFISLPLLWLQCAPQVAGGNGSETTNGKVVYANGTPAGQAKVFAVADSSWIKNVRDNAAVIIDSTITDNAGNFSISRSVSAGCNIQILSSGEGALVKGSALPPVVVLSPCGTLQGTIASSYGSPAEVLLAQTASRAQVSASGSFVIENVVPGVHPVVVRLSSGAGLCYTQNVICGPGDTLRRDSILAAPDNILLDDFEDRDNRNNLGPMLGGGWWQAYSDSFAGGTSALVSPVNAGPLNFTNAIVNDGVPRGNCLRVVYTLGTQGALDPHPYPYVYAGFTIGSGLYDLSGFDTLSFFAQGSGSVAVEFVQHPGTFGIIVYASCLRPLPAAWGEVRITPADLAVTVELFPQSLAGLQDSLVRQGLPPYTQRPATWQEMSSAINEIHFVCTGGSECRLDDIRLHGVNLTTLIK